MRNFNFNLSGFNRDSLVESAYVVSHSNNSYQYYISEYGSLPRLDDGSIIVPPDYEVEVKPIPIKEKLTRLRKKILGESGMIIPPSSDVRAYYLAEFRGSICEDTEHNILVPSENAQQLRLDNKR